MAHSTAHGSTRLLSAGEAAHMLGVTDQSIRNYCRSGELDFVVTVGGHRRVTVASVRRWLGEDDEPDSERQTAIYCRCSTSSQTRDGNLDRQKERLIAHCDSLGLKQAEIIVISETGSGLNEGRKGFLRLVDLIIGGKVSRVIVEHEDRILRYGIRLFQLLCDRMGVELIVTNAAEKEISDEEEMAADIMSLVTVYSARIHGKRGGETKRMVVSDEAKSRILHLDRAGIPQTEIADIIGKDDSLRCPKTTRPYGLHAVRQTLIEQQKLEKVIGREESPIETFIAERCIRADGERCFTRPFHREFCEWAEGKGLETTNSHALSHAMRRLGYSTGRTSSGFNYWQGFKLRDNERASRSHLA